MAPPHFPGLRALIVHSTDLGAQILADHLRDWGASVDVSTGLDGSPPRVHTAPGKTYDVAFVDVGLIEERGGTLVEALQGLAPEVRVALLAPMDFAYDQEARRCGAEVCLRRPVRREELLRFLEHGTSSERAPDDRSAAHRDLSPQSARILVVEDNPTNQTVARAMLESLGIDVELAADGLQAVERTASVDYDLVLMDCQMPRMDGYEASRTIRERERRVRPDATAHGVGEAVPIVAMTASAMAGERERCAAAGMNGYLSKPFDYEQLLLTLKHHLGGDWRAPAGADLDPPLDAVPDEEPGSSERAAAIDPRPLEIIRSLSPDGDDSLVGTVIRSFLEDAPRLLDEMRSGLESGDLSQVQRSAHQLKSSSANLGAVEVSKLSRELENLGRTRTGRGMAGLIDRLERAYARAKRELEKKWHRAA